MQQPLQPNMLVAGRYRLERELGQGGMGALWVAVQEPLGRRCALKLIRADLARHPKAKERFKREAKLISQLAHPHVVTLYDFGEADGVDGALFIAMELLEGRTLRDHIVQLGALPPRASALIARDVLDALAAAHERGIVHRDLKPDNVMIAKGPRGVDVVKLLDFGLAKLDAADAGDGARPPTLGLPALTATGLIVGTPGYLAPEVVLHGKPNDARSDLYAVGVMWFEMLAGRPLFTAPTPMALLMRHATERPPRLDTLAGAGGAGVPRALAELIDRMLAKEPAERPGSANDVIGLIDNFLTTPATTLPPSDSLPPAAPTLDGTLLRMEAAKARALSPPLAAQAPLIPAPVGSPASLPPPPVGTPRPYSPVPPFSQFPPSPPSLSSASPQPPPPPAAEPQAQLAQLPTSPTPSALLSPAPPAPMLSTNAGPRLSPNPFPPTPSITLERTTRVSGAVFAVMGALVATLFVVVVAVVAWSFLKPAKEDAPPPAEPASRSATADDDAPEADVSSPAPRPRPRPAGTRPTTRPKAKAPERPPLPSAQPAPAPVDAPAAPFRPRILKDDDADDEDGAAEGYIIRPREPDEATEDE